jgi:hypothetical protein
MKFIDYVCWFVLIVGALVIAWMIVEEIKVWRLRIEDKKPRPRIGFGGTEPQAG